MTEHDKLKYAKTYIDKLANGINPLDNTQIPEHDIVNNVHISRCLFYISNILHQIIESENMLQPRAAPKKSNKAEFFVTEQQKAMLQCSDNAVSVSEIANYINTLIDSDVMKRLSANTINQWLIKIGLLETIMLPNGKKRKMPTARGHEFGIFTEERIGRYGTNYAVVLFSPSAQQFVFDNLDAFIGDVKENDEDKKEFEYQGLPWTESQEELLIELFQKNHSVSEIANILQRTRGGIRARLIRLGLINQ